MADFETDCAARGIRLFVLPPRSPKFNGAVERANRTHTEEFYEVTAAEPGLEALAAELRAWELPPAHTGLMQRRRGRAKAGDAARE